MSIRWKLLALLLIIALVPLLAATIVAQFSTRTLSGALVSDTRTLLVKDTEAKLEQIVRTYATYVDQTIESLNVVVEMQAAEAASVLSEPPPSDSRFVLATDLDAGVNLPPDWTTDDNYAIWRDDPNGGEASQTPLPIARSIQSIVAAPGTDEAIITRSAAQLAQLTEYYSVLGQMQDQLIYWQYTGLADGVHASYPAHGGYPPTYDPRTRPWYTDVVGSLAQGNPPRPVWSRPIIDASTRQAMLTVSHAVTNDEGLLLGVTALDIRLADILGRVDEWSKGWEEGSALYLLASGIERPGVDPDAVYIWAQRSDDLDGGAWLRPPETPPFTLDTPEATQRVRTAIADSESATFAASINGEQMLCVVAPVGAPDPRYSERAGVLMAFPLESVVAPAAIAEAGFLRRLRLQLTTNLGIVLLVAGAAVAVALGASRSITKPVAELVTTANQIAGGDLDARAPIHTNDEIGRLGQTFNDMVPVLQDRLRMRDSLEMAMEVQQRLLPQKPPAIPGFQVAGVSQYCDETGGDYYDFLTLPTQTGEESAGLGIALGDVTGHGIAAAILMATGRAMLRARVERPGPLNEQIDDVNRQLAADAGDGRFMTLFYLTIQQGQPLRWTSAGHDPAILIRPPKNDQPATAEELAGEDIPLAIQPDWEYHQAEHPPLQPAETLAIGTDGIWEARNNHDEMFGKDRFYDVLKANAEADPQTLCDAVLRAVETFRDGHEQLDDITMVVIKATGSTEVN
ncbi:MAG: SpoIIE family protein phosphatase [Planctomycetota bacterium]